MKALFVSVVGALLVIFLQVLIAESQQRIREGRCPAVKRRKDCPTFVWDECTCDLDCQGKKKCCLDGCKYACLDPATQGVSIRNKADVVFIMDSSGSIGRTDYDREKQFVKDLTNVFHVSSNATRVSTIIYSDFPKLIFDFDTYSDKQSINTAIDNLEYLGNRTRIDKALALALTVFTKSRPSVPRIAFVLTDGKQTEDYDAKPLDIAVRPLHDLGVQVYVIGIGSYIEQDELHLLARRREDVFFVSSFEILLQQTYRIVNQVDTYDLIPPLDITADILFLLDSSSAVPRSDYQQELDFLKKLVELFRISSRYVRAGIISYGSMAELSIPLGRHATNEAINRSIDSIPYIGGRKRIDQALILANQTFSQARPLVPKIMLILTHGGQQAEPGADLRTPVQALRDQGVTMFVIAIGDNVDYLSLGQIVQRNNMIADKSHKELEPYLPFAASYIRVNSDFSTPLLKDAAVVFLIDSSENVDSNNFKRQKEFVISLAKAFKIPDNGVRASLITYGREARSSVQLKDSVNFNDFLDSMIKTGRIQGPRRMDKALRLAVRMFRDHVRPGPRAVVLFTSGPQEITESTDLDGPIKQLENLNARIYVVAIGPEVPYREVRSLVNDSNDVIQIPSFLKLQYELHAIGRHISLTQGARQPFMADVVFLMDSSSDVGIENYRRQKDFVKAVAKALNLGEQATRACLVVYSDRTRLITRFDSHKTLRQFESAVNRAPYVRGPRRVDKAIEYAANLLRRARRGAPKVLVLITSGTRASGNPLDVASEPLKAIGAKSFIVAIGNAPNIKALRLIVDKDSDIFRVPSFPRLLLIEGSFPKHIISAFGSEDDTEDSTTNVNADVIFLMDSSKTVSSEAYRKEKSFLKSIAKHLNVSPGKSRAALVTYGSSASLVYPFGNTRFDDFVDRAGFVSGVRRLDLALQEASRLLSSARPSVPKLVVLLTAGNQASGSPSPDAAGRLVRTRGGKPFVIMIGREPDEDVFVNVVEKSTHLFKVPSFDGMQPYAGPLAKTIEENLKEEPVKPAPITHIADVVFVLDSSSDVPFAEYKKEKDFVKALAKGLNVSLGNSRAALVAYGNRAAEVIGFDDEQSLSDFETAVDNTPYINGDRRIDRALNKTVQIMADARPSATKIVVLVTAGKQTSELGSQTPGEAALPLLANGVYNYVVAIGREPDIPELLPMVPGQLHIFRMASYDDLGPRATLVAQMIIDTSTAPKPITDIVSDVILMMDSSIDVTQEDYIRQKTFVKDMARYLNVSPGRSRAAVITYGSTANLLFKFGGHGTLPTFDKVVDMAPFVGGERRMDLALKDAGLLLIEARPYKTKWVILLTAGPHPATPNVTSLLEASKSVRELSDKVYVVAIGNKVNIRELRDLVFDPRDIFPVISSQSLKPQGKLIAFAVVKGCDDLDCRVVKTFTADVVFLVDTSSSVGTLDFRSQKQFVKSMAKSLNVAPGNSRAAIITYGAASSQPDSPGLHASLSTFQPSVDGSQYIGGSRRMHLAVDSATGLLRTARLNVYKVVVLLTGGNQSFPQEVSLLAQSFKALRASGAKVFVVAIGSNHQIDGLRPVVERLEDIFRVASFETLVQEAWNTSRAIAERTDPIVPRDFQADILFIMDSSADVPREDYKKEKDFVVALAKYLRLSPSETRAALLTYGYTATLVANYDSYDTLPLFKNAAERASYIGGLRRLDKALDYASELIPNARKLLPKIVLLLTAGRQELGYPFDLEATKLQDQGAKTYIVVIGDKPNLNELQPIVKDRKDVFKISSFGDLQQKVLSVAQELGKQPDPKLPDNFQGADVLFIVDSSSDVSPHNYDKEKELVKALTNVLSPPQANSRIAFITYGNRPRVVFDLDNDLSTVTLQRAIDLTQPMGGGRRTDRALEEGVRLMRNSKGTVPKIVLLITAGRQIEEEGVQLLSSSGRALQEIGANAFVLAIGETVSKQELRPVVVNAEEDLFTVKTFEGFTWIVRRLAYTILQRTLGSTVPESDIVFVMDSSSEVTQSNYRDEKEAVKSMARSLKVPSGRSRASVITYGSIPYRVVRFDGYRTFSGLEREIDRAPTITGGRRIDLALEDAGRLLSEARPSARRIVILFTSGRASPSSRDLYTSARRIFQQKAQLFIVAIGGRPYHPGLTAVVNKPEHVYNVSSFANLERESETAIRRLVQRPQLKRYSNFTADVILLVDSSFSVNQSLFNREKAFVKSMVRSLDLSPGKSRVAVISYGSTPSGARFSSLGDIETVASEVDNIRYVSGRRDLAKALQYAGSLLNQARTSVARVIVLLTSGGELNLAAPSQSLKDHGTNRYVIAIGASADEEDLIPIIDDARDLFSIPTPHELTWRTDKIIDDIIKRTTVKKPTTPKNVTADIVFLLDSSSGVGEENYQKQKDFVASLAKQLNFGSGKTRVAAILYSDYARQALRFDVVNNSKSLKAVLDGLPFLRGGRRFDRALSSATQILGTSRKNVRKIVILLAGGQQTQDLPLDDAVKRLKAVQAERFVIAIEPQASKEELRPVVERNEDVLSANTFEGLSPKMEQIAEHIAKGPGDTSVEQATDFIGDVVFLVDSSATVSQDNFTKETDFVKTMARLLNVKPEKSRAAVISYGTNSTLVTRFTSYNSVDEFENIVDSAPFESGPRRMDLAIRNAGRVLGEARRYLPKVVILLTSGPETQDPETEDLYDAAEELRNFNAEVFVVAIGSNPDINELLPLVKKRDDVFQVSSFNILEKQSRSMAKKITEPPQDFKADIVFLIDSSTGVTRDNFNKEKEFIKHLSAALNHSPQGSRVAIVLYAYNSRLAVRLGILQAPESLSSSLDGLTSLLGLRRMDTALEYASRAFDISRPDVRKIVVMLTSGPQSRGGNPLYQAVQPLRTIGAETYVIAIGSQVNVPELTSVVKRNEDVFSVPSFDGLLSSVKPIADYIINASRPVIPPTFKTDILFIMDSSSLVNIGDFRRQKEFVKSMIAAFHVKPGQSRAAAITYGQSSDKVLRFNSYLSVSYIESAIDTASRIGGTARLDKALTDAYDLLKDSNPTVPRIVVLFTAVRQKSDPHKESTAAAAEKLHDLGARVYVIAVGRGPDVDRLGQVADHRQDVFIVPGFIDLRPNRASIAEKIFKRVEEDKPVRPVVFSADIVFIVDSSIEVSRENYSKEKDFVKLLAKTLNLAPGQSRAAVIVYSSLARTEVKFDDHSNSTLFDEAVDKLPYLGFLRRMDLGLQKAAAAMKDARPGVPKIAVLLTAGRQSPPSGLLDESVKPLRKLGAKVFVVAVGSMPDSQELSGIVDQPGDVRRVPNFDGLALQTRPISKYIVNNTGSQPSDKHLINVIFLLDASLRVSRSDFTKEKDFVKSVARSLQLPLEKSKVAAIPYGSLTVTPGQLIPYQSLNDFDRDVDTLQILSGTRRMDVALTTAKNILGLEKSPGRNIVILMTAGRQALGYRGTPLSDSGKEARNIGAEIYVVAIGREPSVEELRPLVADSRDIYQVGSFDYLKREAQPIGKDIVNVGGVRPFDVTADIVIMIDSSDAIGEENYEKEKRFIKHLARLVNVTSEKSRIAVIVYSGFTVLAGRFDGYKSLDEFDKSIDEIPLLGGSYRRMDLALQSAAQVFNSARKDVSRIAVLLSAGRQVPGGISLGSATKQLRSFNTSTLVLAVGQQYSKQELSPVVTAPEDLFEFPSFDSLVAHANMIGQAIADKSAPEPEGIMADIVFLVDSSSSVTSINFRLEKKFVNAMARSLNASPNKSRASVIVYGSTNYVVLSLEEFTDLDDFKLAVDSASYIDGPRRMDLALDAAAAVMNRTRENVPKIVVLLTSGVQSPTSTPDPLGDVVRPLRDLGVQTFVVSIGSEPDKRELVSLVESPRDIFELPSFEALLPQTDEVTKSIAERTEHQPLDVDADIVFLVDTSSFVTQNNFVKEKQFVKSLAKFLNVSSEASRASLVLYGSSPNTEIRFGDYRTLNEFNARVDQARLFGGSRRMDLALSEADDVLAEGRRGVPHIVVLVTAGKQTSNNDSMPLYDAVKSLEKRGAHTFLVAIAHDPENSSAVVVPVRSFNDLPSRAQDMARRIKDESGMEINSGAIEPKPANISADVVFLIDSSTAVGQNGFDKEKNFVKSLAKYLNVSPGKSRAAVIIYSDTVRPVLTFTGFQMETDFNQKLDEEPWIGGTRRIDRALEAASTLLSQAGGNAPKIVVLVTGGGHNGSDGDTPLGIAGQPLKDMGAKTIIVTVGSEADHTDFLPVVDSRDDIFGVPLFDDLHFEVQPIVKYVVKHFASPVHNITAEVVFVLDASTTIGRDNFDTQKTFVKLLARSLNVAPEKSRAALVTYSTYPFTLIPLGNYSTVQDFERILDAISFYKGERRMDRALEDAVHLFKAARPGVQRKVILLTGGRQTPGFDEEPLDKIKQRLLDVGALPFIVAIGDDHDFETLTTVVENPEDIIKIPSFEKLLSEVGSTAAEVARRTTPPPLQDEYIIFLLDSSSAVRPEQFKIEKDFIKTLARYLNVGSTEKTKAAVVNYGSFPFTGVQFDGYSTLRDFQSGVDRMVPSKGSRRIDRALDEAAGIFKQTDPSSSKILVLLTSGRQAPESDVTPFDVAIQPLRDMGTDTYVIAIGSEPSARELRPLVSKAEDLFRVLFDVMQSEVPRIIEHIRKENPRPGPGDDFVFLMDSSSDVTRLDFSREMLFVKTLARELSVSLSEFHAAVIAYGNRHSPVVRFGSYSSLPEFYSAVDSSIYQGGARRMDRVLEASSVMLSSRKPDSRKTVVLLTGGRNAQEVGSNSLGRSVQRLREMGAKVIIMAFGSQYDVQELLPIVFQQQDIHPVPGANDLVPYVNLIATYITLGPTDHEEQPEMEADVLFVIDSSYEVSQDDYKSEKDFIKSLLRSLNMSSDSSRAALITFGDRASLVSRFTGLQKLEDFDKSIDSASYIGGDRRIDKGLKMVARVLHEAGKASLIVVIFLTGGRQASSGGTLDDPVEPVRQSGAKTFVIAIGKNPDVQELRPLVASPKDVVTVVSFKDLDSQTKRVASHISSSAVSLRPDDIVDIVFLVDASSGVNSINFSKEKSFVKFLAKRVNVSPGKSHAAVIAYGSYSKLSIDFDSYRDLPAFERLVNGVAYLGGARRIDEALEAAVVALEKSRPTIPKIVVLLTSGGQPVDAPSLAQSAGKLHSLGAILYVVSIANDLDPKYFEVLVEDSKHVSRVTSFDALNNALSKVIRGIEEGVASRKRLNADVVFLMDASTADNSKYFQSQKVLIKSMMKNLGASTDHFRASLILYSSSTSVLSDLSSYTTPQRFEATVDSATYLRGIRRIDKALAAAVQQLSQSRPSAAKIVVLITTGRQAQVIGMTTLGRASQPLRDANVNILVIGIGKQPDIRELNLITKNPQDVEIIPSPDEVVINVHVLARQLRVGANEGKQTALIPRADLIFLLDSSDDVPPTVFKQQKDFIKSVVGQFPIAPNKTRVVVIRYSSSASSVITFNTFENLPDLVTGIENVRSLPGGRRLDAALKEANKVRESARPNVPTYVIVLTAGPQAVTPVSTPLDTAAQPLFDSKAHVIVVGIGSQPDDRELRSIAERDRDMFRLLPAELQIQAPFLVVYMASQAGAPLPSDFKADVLFLVDSSQTISKEKFQRELDFIKAFVRTLNIAPDKSRVSVVSFGSTPAPPSIRFEADYTNIETLLRAVDVVPYIGGQKRLDKALLFAARVLSKGRADATKILLVLTDGKQPLGDESLSEAAKPLHEIGAIVNVIGAGENVDMGELGKITSRPDDLFYSRTFDNLFRQVPMVYEQIISVGAKPQNRVRHGLFLVDSSGYRSPSEFATQINFIKSIAKHLDVSPNGTRAGVILYHAQPQLSIGLNEYNALPEFYALLDGLSQQGGERELHEALTLAGETLKTSPEDIPKFVVVFVDGLQYLSNGKTLLRDAIRPLHALGVTVYVVGIGNRLNRPELEAMVQNSEHIVTVSDYAVLLRQVVSISDLIDFTITAPCKGILDVGFVVDASGSMGLDNFSREKNFVKLVSRRFADSSLETRLGLMSFSDTPKLFVDFGDFKRMTIDRFQTIVDELPFQGGRSRIDHALKAASRVFFTDKRRGVPRVLVLVSDGRQSKDPGYVPLSRAVKPLQGQQVKVLAVGFGENVHTRDLEVVTSSADNIISEKEFDDIERLQRELVSRACNI